MAFDDVLRTHKLPEGASDRYRLLNALERQLHGTFYDDLRYAWETESNDRGHIPTRERRPSTTFNAAHLITEDVLGDLFGDEQFPIVRVVVKGTRDEDAAKTLAAIVDALDLAAVVSDVFRDAVVGSAAVVLRRGPSGTPFFEILPGKWCDPQFLKYSTELVSMPVTYPIDREWVEKHFPAEADKDKAAQDWWYHYEIGLVGEIDFLPLPASKFARLGTADAAGNIIAWVPHESKIHGFAGRVPCVWAKNLDGRPRDVDGPALWWPARDDMVTLDYTLSQIDRGLRYSADPMLFVRRGDLFDQGDGALAGYEGAAGGMATNTAADGSMVKGVTQTLVGGPGSDAKLLEIGAAGIKEEREFAKDVREYILEQIAGQKASAEHTKGEQSGSALKRLGKPLRRIVRRQRRPYGNGLLLGLIDLVVYALRMGVVVLPRGYDDIPWQSLPENAGTVLEWPNDEEMTGPELLAQTQAAQFMAGGSLMNPVQLLKPEVVAAKLAGDVGIHEPFDAIKGTCEPQTDPEQPAKIAAAKAAAPPTKPGKDNDSDS